MLNPAAIGHCSTILYEALAFILVTDIDIVVFKIDARYSNKYAAKVILFNETGSETGSLCRKIDSGSKKSGSVRISAASEIELSIYNHSPSTIYSPPFWPAWDPRDQAGGGIKRSIQFFHPRFLGDSDKNAVI